MVPDFFPENELLGSIFAGLIAIDEQSDVVRLVIALVLHYLAASTKGSSLTSGMRIISVIHSLINAKLLQGLSQVSTTCLGRCRDVQPRSPLNAAWRHNDVFPKRDRLDPSLVSPATGAFFIDLFIALFIGVAANWGFVIVGQMLLDYGNCIRVY